MHERILRNEILDHLAPDDARARRSRRDLRLINRVMGNDRWWRGVFAGKLFADARMLEIGAGDGAMLENSGGRVFDAIDLAPRPLRWPAGALWHRGDVRAFAAWARYDAIVGNLVFHHFSDEALAVLGERLRKHARVIAACEPLRARRYRRALAVLCGMIVASNVTKHDGSVSIDAGFRGEELPELLGLERPTWTWSVAETWTGAYRMIAERRET
jgi:hypothetical protein